MTSASTYAIIFSTYILASIVAIYYVAPAIVTGNVTENIFMLKVFPVCHLLLFTVSSLFSHDDELKEIVWKNLTEGVNKLFHLPHYNNIKKQLTLHKVEGVEKVTLKSSLGKDFEEKQSVTGSTENGNYFFSAVYGLRAWRLRTGGMELGLFFSVVGDGFMLQQTKNIYFVFGLVAFTLAQHFFIYSFGFDRSKIVLKLPLYGATAFIIYFLLTGISTLLRLVLTIYGFLLATMLWTAFESSDKYETHTGELRIKKSHTGNFTTAANVHNGGRRTEDQKIFAILGSVLFVASQLSVFIFRFTLNSSSVLGQVFILFTYYSSQGFITASAC